MTPAAVFGLAMILFDCALLGYQFIRRYPWLTWLFFVDLAVLVGTCILFGSHETDATAYAFSLSTLLASSYFLGHAHRHTTITTRIIRARLNSDGVWERVPDEQSTTETQQI